MINLLPQEQKRLLLREFYLRFVVVCLTLGSVGLFIANVFLLPWYVAARAEVSTARGEATVRAGGNAGDTEKAQALLSETNNHVERLQSLLGTVSPMSYVQEVLRARSSSISVESFSFTQPFGQPARLLVTGAAEKRSDLVAFRDTLKASPVFQEVILPFTDLAKSTDVSFTFTLVPKIVATTSSSREATMLKNTTVSDD